jgi:hypothetical protein
MVMSGDRVASTDIHVVWPQAKHLPSKTRVTIDALVDRIPKLIAFSASPNAVCSRISFALSAIAFDQHGNAQF